MFLTLNLNYLWEIVLACCTYSMQYFIVLLRKTNTAYQESLWGRIIKEKTGENTGPVSAAETTPFTRLLGITNRKIYTV